MGYIVDRPPVAGVGEKPTTPKPIEIPYIAIHTHLGSKPATVKPTQKPAVQDQKKP
jgi:hypothetical protein